MNVINYLVIITDEMQPAYRATVTKCVLLIVFNKNEKQKNKRYNRIGINRT